MTMIEKYQGTYVALADATVDQTALDGSTAGYTIHWSDLPARSTSGGCMEIGYEVNTLEFIALEYSSAVDGHNGTFKLYGYSENGPAELIADVSCTVGTARIDDSTTALYVDSMTVDVQGGMYDASVWDSAANRVAKLKIDNPGYKYIALKWYDITGMFRAMVRFW